MGKASRADKEAGTMFCCGTTGENAVAAVDDAPPIPARDRHVIIPNAEQDTKISAALNAQIAPSQFTLHALRMVAIMKRRVEAARATRKLNRKSRTGLPKAAIERASKRLSASDESSRDASSSLPPPR